MFLSVLIMAAWIIAGEIQTMLEARLVACLLDFDMVRTDSDDLLLDGPIGVCIKGTWGGGREVGQP